MKIFQLSSYSTNHKYEIYETKNILQEKEVVLEITDDRDRNGQAKFRFKTKEELATLINRLTELSERWS